MLGNGMRFSLYYNHLRKHHDFMMCNIIKKVLLSVAIQLKELKQRKVFLVEKALYWNFI